MAATAERVIVQIDKVVPGGAGLGFHEGSALFVPFTAPGDRIVAEVTKKHSNCLFGRCVEILAAGAERTEPACERYTVCGGCQLRHLTPACQQRIKGDFVRETLGRFPNLRDGELRPAWGVEGWEDGYRCRASFKVRWVGSRLLVGFFQAASHHIADLPDHCPVLDRRLSALIAPLRVLIASLAVCQQLPQVDAVVGEEGVGLIFHLLVSPGQPDRERLQQFARQQGIAQLWLQRGRKSGLQAVVNGAELFYRLESQRLSFHPGDFIQAHREGNRLLVREALRQGGAGEVAWDLFCGIGNFTLPLAQRFARVVGVEGYAPALQRGEANAREAQLSGVCFRALDLFQERQIARLAAEPAADLVLLDPPREGALAVVKWLIGTPIRRLVYVSCNPATFARDASLLVRSGFRLERLQPIDLFPQTFHLELVALFVRPG
ncbi:MAG: 23S rRNA (uracil(1939)-C(5))-methyltransferase RlmD [Magnetococcales bacterium]|nr:23S rRNA (uracil(1939)-C(5))-methyltransferase RlmD [Magnetococcales bacterium]